MSSVLLELVWTEKLFGSWLKSSLKNSGYASIVSNLFSIMIWKTKAAMNKSGQKMDHVLHRRA